MIAAAVVSKDGPNSLLDASTQASATGLGWGTEYLDRRGRFALLRQSTLVIGSGSHGNVVLLALAPGSGGTVLGCLAPGSCGTHGSTSSTIVAPRSIAPIDVVPATCDRISEFPPQTLGGGIATPDSNRRSVAGAVVRR